MLKQIPLLVVTFLLGVAILFPALPLLRVGFNAIRMEPTPILWRHTLADACFQTVGMMMLSGLFKWIGLSKPKQTVP